MYTVSHIPIPDTDYTDNYYKSMVSFSHLIGSLSGIITNYFTSAFGDGFIKCIWNKDEEPFEQREAAFQSFMKKPKPCLLVSPKFNPSDDAEFRPLSEFDNEVSNHPSNNIKLSLRDAMRVIEDKSYEFYFRLRRFKMEFDISMVFDSDAQRIQAEQYFRQAVRHRLPMIMKTNIENYIPDEYARAISQISGYKYGSDEFEKYLNSCSIYPFKYRFRTGSGRNEYFLSINTPIQITFTEAPSSDGPVKRGNIVVKSSFSENIAVEFVAPSMYILRTYKNIDDSLKSAITDFEDDMNIVTVPIADFVLPEPETRANNFIIYRKITIQASKNGEDTINLRDLIDDHNILGAISLYDKESKDVDFLSIEVFAGNASFDGNFKLDTKTLNITFTNLNMYESYVIVIYVNRELVNNIYDNTYKTERNDT